jgi:hypothetical protein
MSDDDKSKAGGLRNAAEKALKRFHAASGCAYPNDGKLGGVIHETPLRARTRALAGADDVVWSTGLVLVGSFGRDRFVSLSSSRSAVRTISLAVL